MMACALILALGRQRQADLSESEERPVSSIHREFQDIHDYIVGVCVYVSTHTYVCMYIPVHIHTYAYMHIITHNLQL